MQDSELGDLGSRVQGLGSQMVNPLLSVGGNDGGYLFIHLLVYVKR